MTVRDVVCVLRCPAVIFQIVVVRTQQNVAITTTGLRLIPVDRCYPAYDRKQRKQIYGRLHSCKHQLTLIIDLINELFLHPNVLEKRVLVLFIIFWYIVFDSTSFVITQASDIVQIKREIMIIIGQ